MLIAFSPHESQKIPALPPPLGLANCPAVFDLENGVLRETSRLDKILNDQMRDHAYMYGEIRNWPTKHRMVEILREAGLRATEGKYSVRVDDCEGFSFEQYGGDLGEPCIEASANSADTMLKDAERVSAALAKAGVIHRFEVYDPNEVRVGMFGFGISGNDY